MPKRKNRYIIISIVLMLFVLSILSYACSGRYLRTQNATPEELSGFYSLILYGGNSPNDLKTIAFLAKEGTPYTFEVFAPDFDYKIIKNISAREALEQAEKFVSFHRDFWKTRLSKIVDANGNTIGYEVRPLYNPSTFGTPDILDVDYKMTDDKVIVYVRPYFRYPVASLPGSDELPRFK